jgi:glutathione peroxidase
MSEKFNRQQYARAARQRTKAPRFVNGRTTACLARHNLRLALNPEPLMTSLYDFEAQSIDGRPVQLEQFRGKALLIVNTASACGFTPQFGGLEKLHQTYGDRGLVVLGFPCNQFGSQDKGSNEEIATFCQKNYGVSFSMMSKIEVNGAQAHPLYQWLSAEAPGLLGSKAIKWNFTKFLVGKDGQVIKRYAPQDAPDKLTKDIEAII